MADKTERRECPDCHKYVAVTKAGALRKHDCVQVEISTSTEPAPAERQVQVVAGRPKCYVDRCEIPEFMDGVGLCGGHWATRPDLRKVARHG